MSRVFEAQRLGGDLVDQTNREIRDDAARAPTTYKFTTDRFTEPKVMENYVMFATGVHAENLSVTRRDGIIAGLPGATVRSLQTVVDVSVKGIAFLGEVDLLELARVVFEGCTFNEVVRMAAGCKAVFTGCIFQGDARVNNFGVAGAAGILGCVRTSGVAHTNVTTIFEVT